MQDEDPYAPINPEVADCNEIFARWAKQSREIDAKEARRRKNNGPSKANSEMWRDKPRGTAHWKAAIAGLTEAYGDLTGDSANARDQVAKAVGIANSTRGKDTRTRPENAIEAVTKKRPYSPGYAGKSVRDFIKTTKQNKDPTVRRTYREAYEGKILFHFAQTHVGANGPLDWKKWIVRPRNWPPQPCEVGLVEALKRAQKTMVRHDIDIACALILAAAKGCGEGRWLNHAKRKPRSTS